MKKIVIASFALLSLATSCKKSKETTVTPQNATSVIGHWRWTDTYGDGNLSSTNPATPSNTGNTEILTFNSDGTWNDVVNGSETGSGTFTLNTVATSTVINFSGGTGASMAAQQYYILSGNTMSFTSAPGIYGGGSKLFVAE